MTFQYNDGGRAEAGFKGTTGDRVCRAIAIATQRPYKEVYGEINRLFRAPRNKQKVKSDARTGVLKSDSKLYLKAIGWKWVPLMRIGSGCTVHLVSAELPAGRIIVKLSRHIAAVIDGVLHDTSDWSRQGTRCVYGYWKQEETD